MFSHLYGSTHYSYYAPPNPATVDLKTNAYANLEQQCGSPARGRGGGTFEASLALHGSSCSTPNGSRVERRLGGPEPPCGTYSQ